MIIADWVSSFLLHTNWHWTLNQNAECHRFLRLYFLYIFNTKLSGRERPPNLQRGICRNYCFCNVWMCLNGIDFGKQDKCLL